MKKKLVNVRSGDSFVISLLMTYLFTTFFDLPMVPYFIHKNDNKRTT